MIVKRILCLSAITIAVSGCQNKPTRPEPIERFITNITEDGGKFFVYSLEMPRPKKAREPGMMRRPPRDGRGMSPGGNPGMSHKRSGSANKLDKLLEETLEETGFCREGFFELERQQGLGGPLASIRGECREGASADDREKFPNR